MRNARNQREPESMRRFWVHLAFALFVSCVLLYPELARSQTIKTDATRADTILHIVKAGGTAFDSAKVERRYNGVTLVRWVRANATDTVRFAKATSPTARTDSVVVEYSTLTKPKRSATAVTARVVPPVVTPPVNGPATTPVPPLASYVVPALPAPFRPVVPAPTRTVRVAAGTNLQAALNSAQPGDELILANGAQWIGNFTLPIHASGWATVRGEVCPAPGVRADSLIGSAIIVTTNSSAAVLTVSGAHGWALRCFRVVANNSALNYGIVVLGSGASTENTLAHLPSDIVLDQMFISGSATAPTSRCIALNGNRLTVTNSMIMECHAKGPDSQGISGWNGAGPFLIDNNHIEGAGQAIMFGGADPWIPNLTPSDITITRNHLFKPLTWAGQWTVKAAFELKHARRLLFEGNVIENHWADAQSGFAFVFQSVNQNNRAPWSTIRDITVRNNLIRNSTSGFNVLARFGTNVDSVTARVLVANNWFEQVGRDPVSKLTNSTSAQFLSGTEDVTFTRNTFTLSGSAKNVVALDGIAHTRLTITDNIFVASSYGVVGTGTGAGLPTLTRFMPGGVFARNVVPGVNASVFPVGALGNAAGADLAAIMNATAGVVR